MGFGFCKGLKSGSLKLVFNKYIGEKYSVDVNGFNEYFKILR